MLPKRFDGSVGRSGILWVFARWSLLFKWFRHCDSIYLSICHQLTHPMSIIIIIVVVVAVATKNVRSSASEATTSFFFFFFFILPILHGHRCSRRKKEQTGQIPTNLLLLQLVADVTCFRSHRNHLLEFGCSRIVRIHYAEPYGIHMYSYVVQQKRIRESSVWISR